MTLQQRILAFDQLGHHLEHLSAEAFESLTESARSENPWFTTDNIGMSLAGIQTFLKQDILTRWTSQYELEPSNPKTIALVMAGNIPLVGFHDFLCVLLSGNHVQIKLSSKDSKLLTYLIKHLVWLEPGFEECIHIKERLERFDAIIATGSNNSSRYFESYFGKYPNIIRKNRTSCAVLTGSETATEIQGLGVDVFSYFGLGCRNVSKIYIPNSYDLTKLLDQWDSFKKIIDHHKYCNNYDYQKSILLVNGVPHLDNGFALIQENEKLVSPISVLYYEYYFNEDNLKEKLEHNQDKLQCIVGSHPLSNVPFGQAQYPTVSDYADRVDTLNFLSGLHQ